MPPCWNGPPQLPTPGALSDADLNRLYNACAIGLNTSAGEGFGLVSFEHAATGAPQVVPDHDALRPVTPRPAWSGWRSGGGCRPGR